MRSLAIILALIGAPAMAADYTPWPGRGQPPALSDMHEAPQLAQAIEAGDVVMVKGSNGSKAGLIAQALLAIGSGGRG